MQQSQMPVVESADQEQYVGEDIYIDGHRFQITTEDCHQHVDGLQEMHAQGNVRRKSELSLRHTNRDCGKHTPPEDTPPTLPLRLH